MTTKEIDDGQKCCKMRALSFNAKTIPQNDVGNKPYDIVEQYTLCTEHPIMTTAD